MGEDIRQPKLGELDWSAGSRSDSLSTVYEHVVAYAESSEEWYLTHRGPKQRGGQVLRVGAICLGAIAAVLPVLSELSSDDGVPAIAPGWATVALAIAAALLALDRFFGFSSAWMRYMVTAQRVASLRHSFEYEWQSARSVASDPPDDAQLTAMLTLARKLIAAVDAAIERETEAWVGEFDSALRQIEQQLDRNNSG